MDIKFLSFDIDDTLLPSHNITDGFYQFWQRLEFNGNLQLCYNTGRLVDDTMSLINKRILPRPDYLICGVGTTIFNVKEQSIVKEFSQVLEEGWDLKRVNQIISTLSYPINKQPEHFQNEYKSSWFLDNATTDILEDIRGVLRSKGLDVNVIYSSNRHLDILPKWANKGNSLEWLLKYLDIDPDHVIVAGNSGNDSAMFNIGPVKGIVVGNAQPELMKEANPENTLFSNKIYQEAILEGLEHFGLDFSLNKHELPGENINIELVNLMDVKSIDIIGKDQYDLIQEGYEHALKTIYKNITPLGFSACSLEDNVSVGTDANYRSVWARDGSITITGTISLMNDENIYNCQKRTIETLLGHISPSGQIPANVMIDTMIPDYSGVGGICSIDSGLWLVIAFHDFVKASGDLDFLRTHIDTLARAMTWLDAHDGNNNSLLEIPEAGDWTDLFGRSYNVLYDEVLWYRANMCMGRLYELLGDERKAGDFITWSQVIKNSIIKFFWPSTNQLSETPNSFDQKQFSIGDARYLIAQITPFDFNWRCDIYGNILAHLFNVIDREKAITTFRFIWGSGGNEPFPVKNVYPAVTAGDPDWRPYYTVNLLNLPDHYHNGGIWPFVGGDWVRYIHKLGMDDLALKELYKLAELNKLGMNHEWEFNEWAHGKTGRPMGKAFQSWSASSFINACHTLGIVKTKK
jgi:sucrose-6F-phosphate phosphohydrolase